MVFFSLEAVWMNLTISFPNGIAVSTWYLLFGALFMNMELVIYYFWSEFLVFAIYFFTEKVDKKVKKNRKVSGPGLYKRNPFVQKRPNSQQTWSSSFCFLFCYCLDIWQVWSNTTKQVQKKSSFPDVVNSELGTPAPRANFSDCGPILTGPMPRLCGHRPTGSQPKKVSILEW